MNTHSSLSYGSGIAEKIAPLILRLALGLTLLSAVADRFAIWGPPGGTTVAWGDWTHFVAYTAKVNSFLPSSLAPALAIIAKAPLNFSVFVDFAAALILGVWPDSTKSQIK
jgi:hypothetical protein